MGSSVIVHRAVKAYVVPSIEMCKIERRESELCVEVLNRWHD